MVSDRIVIVTLTILVIANLLIYGRHRRRFKPRKDRPHYPLSLPTRLFRYLMPAIYLAVIADPWVYFLLFPHRPVNVLRFGAGLLVAVFALALQAASLAALGEHFAPCYEGALPKARITHGPYRHLAHPIYAANLLLFGAFLVIAWNLPLLALTLVTAVFYLFSIRDEERAFRTTELFREAGDR